LVYEPIPLVAVAYAREVRNHIRISFLIHTGLIFLLVVVLSIQPEA